MNHRTIFPIFFLLLLASIVFLFLSHTAVFQVILERTFSPFQAVVMHTVRSYNNKNISSLKEENMLLTEKLVNEQKLQEENNALHDQFQSSAIQNDHLVPAHVIGMPNFIPGISYPEYLIVDQGIHSGIKVGQAVVYKTYAIGLIDRVNDSFARIHMVTNTSSAFPAVTMQTKVLGIIRGQGNRDMIFDNVILSDHLEQNDLILTKGSQNLDGLGYPPGLILGKITAIERNSSALFQKANIQIGIDVLQLTTVFVIVNR